MPPCRSLGRSQQPQRNQDIRAIEGLASQEADGARETYCSLSVCGNPQLGRGSIIHIPQRGTVTKHHVAIQAVNSLVKGTRGGRVLRKGKGTGRRRHGGERKRRGSVPFPPQLPSYSGARHESDTPSVDDYVQMPRGVGPITSTTPPGRDHASDPARDRWKGAGTI